MMIDAEVIRGLLLGVMLAMALLAFFYLRGRRLSAGEFLRLGLLALLLPLLGPFLVILMKPGQPRKPHAGGKFKG